MQRNDKPKKMPRKLEKAIKTQDIATVKTILAGKKFQDPHWLNAVNGRGRTPLLLALKYKSWDIARLLLSYPDTDVNVLDPYNLPVIACAVRDFDLTMQLLDDPRLKAPDRKTTQKLLYQFYEQETQFLALLQKLNAKDWININLNFGGEAASLWWACVNSQVSVVKYLLAQPGIDVNENHPLTEVLKSYYLNPEIVKMLLAHPQIDVNRSNGLGNSPMDVALSYNEMNPDVVECIKLLLCDPRLDKNWRHFCGSGLLSWLQQVNQQVFAKVIALTSTKLIKEENKNHRNHESKYELIIQINLVDVINVLINDPEFDMNRLYSNGQTLLTFFISNGPDKIVDLLLDCPRVNLHRQDQFGHSALTQADECGKHDMVDKIMHHPRFKLHATYHHNRDLLMHAAEKDCAGLVKILLPMNEFSVYHVDDVGNTALNLLAQHHKNPNDASLFVEFLHYGANPELRNTLGTNAIMSAENNNLKGIASDLRSAAPGIMQQPIQVVQPSAPPLSVDPTVNATIIEAAQQPPQGYYQQGLFGASAAQPQQVASNTDALANHLFSL